MGETVLCLDQRSPLVPQLKSELRETECAPLETVTVILRRSPGAQYGT